MTPNYNDPLEESFDRRPVELDVMALSRLARGGDAAALNRLFELYGEPLRRIVSVRLGTKLRGDAGIESMDVVQNTFMRAQAKFPEFEALHEGAVLAWLARMAELQIRDEYGRARAEKRGGDRVVRLEDARGGALRGASGDDRALELAGRGTLPEGYAERQELAEIVDECVAELNEEHRELILLRVYAQADWKTIAQQIGAANVKAAEAKFYRARIALASRIARRLPDED